MAGESSSSWSVATTLRKYPLKKKGAFHKVRKFKKINPSDGTIEYREFMVPSPTTALAESVVLQSLAAKQAFAKSDSVYSYLWPKDDSHSSNFIHYSGGYKKRNEDIEQRLRSNSNLVALVSDIEKFYPTIDQASLKARFDTAVRTCNLDKDVASTAQRLLDHIFLQGTNGKGVFTGPEISHVAGDLALRNVDAALEREFPDGYFRYVDDIVLLMERDRVPAANLRLKELLATEDLVVHVEKTDWLAADEWLANGPHNHSKVQEQSFEALLFQLKVFLLLHPERQSSLERLLEAEGIAIPIARLVTISRGKQFRPKFWSLWARRWYVAVRAWNANERDIVSDAIAVRSAVQGELDALLTRRVPESGTRRRWYMQRLRYLVNRSLYLLDDSQLRKMIGPLASLPEFAEAVALLKVLVMDDASWLLNMPGVAVNVAGERLSRRGAKISGLEKYTYQNPATLESLAILGLHGALDIPDSLLALFATEEREYLQFCMGYSEGNRSRDDFSYMDEIRCLQLGRTRADIRDAIETRFSDEEASVFDGLYIGSGQSS